MNGTKTAIRNMLISLRAKELSANEHLAALQSEIGEVHCLAQELKTLLERLEKLEDAIEKTIATDKVK